MKSGYRTIPYQIWKSRQKNAHNSEYLDTTKFMTISDIAKFCSKIEYGRGCWIFRSNMKKSHAHFKGMYVYRIAYELYVGRIPDGMTLDHLCLNARCVNPKHLEPVSLSINSKRNMINRYM